MGNGKVLQLGQYDTGLLMRCRFFHYPMSRGDVETNVQDLSKLVPDGFEDCRACNYFHMKNTAIINTFRASLYRNLWPWLTHAICSSKRELPQCCSEGFLECKLNKFHWNIDGLAQDCSNAIADAIELLQSCAKPSICYLESNWQCVDQH